MFMRSKDNKHKINIFFMLVMGMNAFVSATQQEVQINSVFVHVKELFYKSLDVGKEEESVVDKKQKLKLKIQQPTIDQMHYSAMDLMVKQPDSMSEKSTLLDRTFLKKMEICCGEEDTKKSLSRLLDQTRTVFGHIMFVRKLAEPIYDIQTLVREQNVAKEFLLNQNLFNEIQTQLDRIHDAEPYFLSYFQKENAVNEELFKKVFWSDKLNFLNSNSWALELGVRLGNLGNFFAMSAVPFSFVHANSGFRQIKADIDQNPISKPKALGLAMVGLVDPRLDVYKNGGFEQRKNEIAGFFQELTEISEKLQKINEKIFYGKNLNSDERDQAVLERDILTEDMQNQMKKLPLAFLNVVPQTLGDTVYVLNNIHGKPKYIALGVLGILAGLQTYLTYNAIQDAMLKQDIANYLQAKMIAVASYINAMKELYRIVKNNAMLSALPGMEALAQLGDPNSSLSYDCRKLLGLLDYNTFNGEASVFSLTGRVLAAHRLMQKVKEELVPACAAAGRIDAYLSVAKLFQKFQNTPAKFCFVDFVENSSKPMVQAVNFWNPFIDTHVVVTNNAELGINNPNNIILTGPNTGGKSTVIKGLLINILLAQTLGIAPAEQLLLTPFANLNCYLNITDDLSAGTSLFKAEVLRAKALINAVRNLRPHEFSFTIIDEVFSGTSPLEGENAALMFAKELALLDKSLCVIATHFPRLTDELSEDYFKNYKVTVYKDANDNWVRPFTLEEGKSLLNIAMDLLREEGIFSN